MATPLQRAMKLHEAGNLAQARTGFERILKKNPRDVNALHYLGVVLHQQGQHEKGARFIQKAIELYPAHPAAYQNLGGIFVSTRQFEKAVDAFRKVIQFQPSNAEAHFYLCTTLCRLGRNAEAVETGRTATLLGPDNKQCWFSLATAYKQEKLYESAIEAYQKAIALDKRYTEAHRDLCFCVEKLERRTLGPGHPMVKTAAAIRNWLKVEPDNSYALYTLAAIEGNQEVRRSPDEYVSVLFDGFADNFDRQLAELNYRGPQLVADRVGARLGAPDASLDILDAGCGTGLLATDLKPFARRLTGVDLSSGMLEKARARGLYDVLERAELTAFLKLHPACYDLLICSDTLVYFGELKDVIRAMHGALKPSGIAICTLERLEDGAGEYRLNPHGRFSHHEDYLKRCLSDTGLSLVSCEKEVLREENGQAVTGMLFDVLKQP